MLLNAYKHSNDVVEKPVLVSSRFATSVNAVIFPSFTGVNAFYAPLCCQEYKAVGRRAVFKIPASFWLQKCNHQ